MKELKGIDETRKFKKGDTVKVVCYAGPKDDIYSNEVKNMIGKEFTVEDYNAYGLVNYDERMAFYESELELVNTEPPTIPEKWCVRRTPENAEVLKAYYGSHPNNTTFFFSDKTCTDFTKLNNDTWPEITFEQWQTIPEHAEWLKENYINFFGTGLLIKATKVEQREIIGYVFKENTSEKIKEACKVIVSRHGDWELWGDNNFLVQSHTEKKLKEAGVLWFDPVYREIEKPVFKVGEYRIYTTGLLIGMMFQVTETHNGNGVSRPATPEEIEAARPREIWEKYPTWESLQTKLPIQFKLMFESNSLSEFSVCESFCKLYQLEKAWNEGKKCTNVWHEAPEDPYYFTVKCKRDGTLYVSECYSKEQINFNTKELAIKSLELHGDLWRKYWMV